MADRVKAWEQNWQAHEREVREDPRADWVVARMSSPADIGDPSAPTAKDRAKLASAAPDMARLLLEYLQEGSMDPDAVARALRKAGVQ